MGANRPLFLRPVSPRSAVTEGSPRVFRLQRWRELGMVFRRSTLEGLWSLCLTPWPMLRKSFALSCSSRPLKWWLVGLGIVTQAGDVWSGLLCDRDDRDSQRTLRPDTPWCRTFTRLATAGRTDDRFRHCYLVDGASGPADLLAEFIVDVQW